MGNPNGGFIHGHKKGGASPTYRTWLGIKRRCSDPKHKDFARYGARGVRVAEPWASSFVTFLTDMGEKPSADHSIDRLNPAGDYAPGNCRWATSFEQGSEHKRSLRAVTIAGERFASLAAACRRYGVGRTTLNERLARGIGLEEAITTPTGKLPNKRSRESYLPKTPIDRHRNALGRFD